MGRQQRTHVMKGFSLAALVLVVLSAKKASSAPQQEQDPWLRVLNGGIEAEERQDVANVEEGAQPVSQRATGSCSTSTKASTVPTASETTPKTPPKTARTPKIPT